MTNRPALDALADDLGARFHLDAPHPEPAQAAGTQPLHTVYVAGDRVDENLPERWGAEAASTADRDGLDSIAAHVGVAAEHRARACELTRRRLRTMPIEDLRLDFEDGYGAPGDAIEDADAAAAGRAAAEMLQLPKAPARLGLRCKAIEPSTWRRALRTVGIFVGAMMPVARTWEVRITLPKVADPAQVTVLTELLAALERRHGIEAGSLGIEVQIELPHLLTPGAGRPAIADAVQAGEGRVRALHYGTYDYSAALGVPPGEQSALHEVAVHARREMQLTAAVLGLEISDGSSNRLPDGDLAARMEAWRVHSAVVGSALREGFPQGWDLHPAQLVTRYLTVYDFLLAAAPEALARLGGAGRGSGGGFLDEPATLRPMARLLQRCLRLEVVPPSALTSHGLTVADLDGLTCR